MKPAVLNVVKMLLGLLFVVVGWYGIGYGFAEATGNPNLFFLGGLTVFGFGVGIIIYVIKNAKD